MHRRERRRSAAEQEDLLADGLTGSGALQALAVLVRFLPAALWFRPGGRVLDVGQAAGRQP